MMSTEQPSVFRTVAKSRAANPEIVKKRTESFADSAAEWTEQPHAQLYYENKDPSIPLVDNKEFRSIKNMAIKTVMEIPQEVEQAEPHVARGIIGSLARLIGDKCMARRQVLQEQIDTKLQAKINEKKQALGLRTEKTQKPSYQTQEEYDMSI